MFDDLKTLIIDGKTVAILSINGRTVWESVPNNILLTDTRTFKDEVSQCSII